MSVIPIRTQSGPVAVRPHPGDRTPNLDGMLVECRQGLPAHEARLVMARELTDWYRGDTEKYVAFRPAEDALSWLTRPKRVSFITRHAVDTLTSHLYKPGPLRRRVTADAEISSWYNRVCKDIHLNGVMQHADRLATLHGLCMLGVYPTGRPARPINYHLFSRQDFVLWCSPDDPRVPVAVCTITRVDHETIRYRLWTDKGYYTFFKGRSWGYTPGGWNVARYDPGTSGPHPYGVLPFAFITHELPTSDLETEGLGHLLRKVNRALNIDKSNLALWVHHYARPLGIVSGVDAQWRPRFIDGGFVPLVARQDAVGDSPVIPEAKYLESSFDIDAVRKYIVSEANEALAEIGVPLTIAVQSDGGGGTMARSGLAIAALDADLITYSKGRQPLFDRHESNLCQLICRVGASPAGNLAGLASALEAVADDPSLRVSWPEPQIDLPGQDRDLADQFELSIDVTDAIEILMRRQGLTEAEAIEQFRSIQRRKAIIALLQADPEAEVVAPEPDGETEVRINGARLAIEDGGERGKVAPDMGVEGASPSTGMPPALSVNPGVSVAVAVDPKMPIPAAPLILPATPGFGSWGTES